MNEFLMGFMGAKTRWRTMPWMVTLFGILVIPLGLSHLALVMSQPAVVHHWSTFALLAAAVMLPMITLTVDEVVAMGQHVRDAVRRGDRDGSAWKVFWMGGQPGESTPDDGRPQIGELPDRPGPVAAEPVRALRFLGGAAGLAVAALVFLTDPDGAYATAIVVTGLLIAVTAVRRGPVRQTYGDWRLLTR